MAKRATLQSRVPNGADFFFETHSYQEHMCLHIAQSQFAVILSLFVCDDLDLASNIRKLLLHFHMQC